MGRLNESNLPM